MEWTCIVGRRDPQTNTPSADLARSLAMELFTHPLPWGNTNAHYAYAASRVE